MDLEVVLVVVSALFIRLLKRPVPIATIMGEFDGGAHPRTILASVPILLSEHALAKFAIVGHEQH